MSDAKLNLMDLDHEGLNEFMLSLEEKKFRADQLMKWIYQFGVTDFGQMTNINKVLREKLASLCVIRAPEVRAENRSLTAFSGRFSSKSGRRFRHKLSLRSRANAGIIQDGKDGINGKTDNPDALEGRQNAR